jgi:NodT family efflux transporter outer membrane factor (OMF) lipoprotein
MRASYLSITAGAILLAACKVGPNYGRPQVAVPPNFRAPTPLPAPQAASLANLKWFEVFHDKKLQDLINVALVNNYDLRDAVTRVEQARANLGITRSNQFPQLSAQGELEITRLSRNGEFPLGPLFLPSQYRNWGEVALNLLSFEVDIWGRLRRATEAARANLLNAEENRKAVVSTLVSDVASNYFQLLESDAELTISQRTLETRVQSLQLTRHQEDHGTATLLDVRQAEQLVDSVAESITSLQQQIQQTENAIALLLGRNPEAIPRGLALLEQAPPDVPPGLPSALLERRPDIRANEQALISANADIGIARAAYFPQITLTGVIGSQTASLANLFSGPTNAWTFVPQITQPIFTAGRLKSGVRLAQALRDQAEVAYEKSIATAFREVSDALVAHEWTRAGRLEQEKLVVALQDRKRLAYIRYHGGLDTQLNALDADRDLLQAELNLARIRYSELVSVVRLYRALGGGWQ